MNNNLLLAFGLVVAALIVLRIGFALWEKFRRVYFSPLDTDRELFLEAEPISSNITVDTKYLSFEPNQNHRVLLRVVSQQNQLQIACSGGILLRVEKKEDIEIKILGPNRLLILGQTPNAKASIRIEISTTEEQRLYSSMVEAFTAGD